jgi:uncharacterized protein (TIGR04255 family)
MSINARDRHAVCESGGASSISAARCVAEFDDELRMLTDHSQGVRVSPDDIFRLTPVQVPVKSMADRGRAAPFSWASDKRESQKMNWEPAHADHSIDRAVVTLTWYKPIDPNTFDELVVAGRKGAAAHHLTNRADLPDPVELPPGGGMIMLGPNYTPPRRVVFQRLDQMNTPIEEFSIGMHRVAFATLRYRRWVNIRQTMTEIIKALQEISPVMQNVKAVRVEYLDRFQSISGGADHFEVIARGSNYLAPCLTDKGGALHVHSGWFDYELGGKARRLTNINIDVTDLSVPTPENRRSLTVLTLGQYEVLDGVVEDPAAQMDVLHDYLKKIFGEAITQEAADRVSLNGN